jgi:hypothetical protein
LNEPGKFTSAFPFEISFSALNFSANGATSSQPGAGAPGNRADKKPRAEGPAQTGASPDFSRKGSPIREGGQETKNVVLNFFFFSQLIATVPCDADFKSSIRSRHFSFDWIVFNFKN